MTTRTLQPRGADYGDTSTAVKKSRTPKVGKYTIDVGVTGVLSDRNIGVPSDYHCKCDYCTKNYIGEIYDVAAGTYYSQAGRRRYYNPKAGTHIAPGHFLGYRWAIQKFTNPGELVFDPTVGTGTAIIEAINNGRNGAGIELEFPTITQANIDYQFLRENDKPTGKYTFIHGNAKELTTLLPAKGIMHDSISLVINGTPYPTLGSSSSDAPERKNLKKDDAGKIQVVNNTTFDYKNPDNFGAKKGTEYWNFITNMYLDCIPFMKKEGKMVILIKDMMQNKKAYLLHKMVIDDILANTKELEYYGMYMHKHLPPTLFMSTYPKTYPTAGQIPLYQTGIVLIKK
jgi:DNA modification methylase